MALVESLKCDKCGNVFKKLSGEIVTVSGTITKGVKEVVCEDEEHICLNCMAALLGINNYTSRSVWMKNTCGEPFKHNDVWYSELRSNYGEEETA